ncbi:YhbY family RNA-binding protein [Salarchaeum sp. III]|uniref:YhbY family RNA-binding protein n=1 Tax=Salarchaeum sp. III TaxID=3107927 RepID=UPI002EDB26BF
MTTEELKTKAHNADVTVWVGKEGVESVVDELRDQLDTRDVVKVKFLRSSRGGTDTEELADDLADRVGADLVETRGNTAVYH